MGEVIWDGLTASRRRAVTLGRYCVRGGISNFAVASRKNFPPFGNKLSPEPIFLSRREVMPLPSPRAHFVQIPDTDPRREDGLSPSLIAS